MKSIIEYVAKQIQARDTAVASTPNDDSGTWALPKHVPTEPTIRTAQPSQPSHQVRYGVNCSRCNVWCPDAEYVPNFRCFGCRGCNP